MERDVEGWRNGWLNCRWVKLTQTAPDFLPTSLNPYPQRAPCIAGRATTCWKAHREEDPRTPLVIKDSWQYAEREEEGELLRKATGQGVVNVARYYHHETIQVRGADDDIRGNVRKGLDVTTAVNYRLERSMLPPSATAAGASRKGRSNSTAPRKRSSSHTDASLPPSKRSCSASPTKAGSSALPNRIHRRVILSNYGKPIYKASSRAALLTALEGLHRRTRVLTQGRLHSHRHLSQQSHDQRGLQQPLVAFVLD